MTGVGQDPLSSFTGRVRRILLRNPAALRATCARQPVHRLYSTMFLALGAILLREGTIAIAVRRRLITNRRRSSTTENFHFMVMLAREPRSARSLRGRDRSQVWEAPVPVSARALPPRSRVTAAHAERTALLRPFALRPAPGGSAHLRRASSDRVCPRVRPLRLLRVGARACGRHLRDGELRAEDDRRNRLRCSGVTPRYDAR